MYSNKLTINSTCDQFVLGQQGCRVSPCKNKNSINVNIQRCTKSQTNIQTQIPISNYSHKFCQLKWAQITIGFNPEHPN